MSEIKVNEIILRFNDAEKFKRIKEHMEMCAEEELSNEYVALQLISIAINTYSYL